MADQDAWIPRIQALLAKAESSEFPEEAEALLSKAQELMVRHAIDEQMLRQGPGTIIAHQVRIEPPYTQAKLLLLANLGNVNYCRAVSADVEGTYTILLGREDDINNVIRLYNILSVNLNQQLLETEVPWHVDAEEFFHSFICAYAGRVGQRLQQSARRAEDEYRQEQAAKAEGESEANASIELASRLRDVDDFIAAEMNVTDTITSETNSLAGHIAGTRAGDRAPIHQAITDSEEPTP